MDPETERVPRKVWMYDRDRSSPEFRRGVDEFIKCAERHREKVGAKTICCPCRECYNIKTVDDPIDIMAHLIFSGFRSDYTRWVWHGEGSKKGEIVDVGQTSNGAGNCNNSDGINANEVSDGENREIGDDIGNGEIGSGIGSEFGCDDYDSDLNNDDFDDIYREVEQEFTEKEYERFSVKFKDDYKRKLYPGCTGFTKLQAVLRLYRLKASNGWSDKSFSELLELMGEMLPDGNELPNSCYRAKRMLCPLSLKVQKIHACLNDCVLFRGPYRDMANCPKCGADRYRKPETNDESNCDDDLDQKGPPVKVLHYFPLLPRLRRLFANKNDAKLMCWHAKGRKNDGKLRHPADAIQWCNFDRKHREFSDEIRNVRFGFSSDGVNPHGNMSSKHSTWPGLLCIYNLPPWLTMKRKYIMLTLLIPGPKQPGNDIDVYLAPLIEDLKKLWVDGVEVFDAYTKERFTLRAMLFCTINDFPAYANLSGYSVKGRKACPICEDETDDLYLSHSNKNVYMGHRRFLVRNHPYRRNKEAFNGKEERERAPRTLSGKQVHDRVKDIPNEFGKSKKRKSAANKAALTWKKKSIFWDLPYWEDLDVRHCLDLMHIEKNVCESLVGTLLGIASKTKDGIKARRDMEDMGIRPALHPKLVNDGTCYYLDPAMHTLSKAEKRQLCRCLHGVKVPSGYSANVKKLVMMDEMKLSGMKSHDCHVLLTQLLPVSIRSILPEPVRRTIYKLCYFFNAISSKVANVIELEALQKEVVVTLCELEMIFPPSFFDIMVHLIVHLVHEIKVCGPAFLRYMYPFERYMGFLKGYVRNRYRPEGSIVQGYMNEEVLEFCNGYMADLPPIGVPIARHEGRLHGKGTIGHSSIQAGAEEHKMAHFKVLQHMTCIAPYFAEHTGVLRESYPLRSEQWIMNEHYNTFASWLKERVKVQQGHVDPSVIWLARGPSFTVITYQGYDINGCTFYTSKQDSKSTLQNSGVTQIAFTHEYPRTRDARATHAKEAYYGKIEEIWELSYSGFIFIPLFLCKWVDIRSGVEVDGSGFTIVDFSKRGSEDDPFILAKQAKQVFYVEDPCDSKKHVVLHGKRRIIGVENVVDEEDFDHCDEIPPFSIGLPDVIRRNDEGYVRRDHEEGEMNEI